jgi:hypothetical protein
MVIPISDFFWGEIQNWQILTREMKLVEFTLKTQNFKKFSTILSKKCEISLKKKH